MQPTYTSKNTEQMHSYEMHRRNAINFVIFDSEADRSRFETAVAKHTSKTQDAQTLQMEPRDGVEMINSDPNNPLNAMDPLDESDLLNPTVKYDAQTYADEVDDLCLVRMEPPKLRVANPTAPVINEMDLDETRKLIKPLRPSTVFKPTPEHIIQPPSSTRVHWQHSARLGTLSKPRVRSLTLKAFNDQQRFHLALDERPRNNEPELRKRLLEKNLFTDAVQRQDDLGLSYLAKRFEDPEVATGSNIHEQGNIEFSVLPDALYEDEQESHRGLHIELGNEGEQYMTGELGILDITDKRDFRGRPRTRRSSIRLKLYDEDEVFEVEDMDEPCMLRARKGTQSGPRIEELDEKDLEKQTEPNYNRERDESLRKETLLKNTIAKAMDSTNSIGDQKRENNIDSSMRSGRYAQPLPEDMSEKELKAIDQVLFGDCASARSFCEKDGKDFSLDEKETDNPEMLRARLGTSDKSRIEALLKRDLEAQEAMREKSIAESESSCDQLRKKVLQEETLGKYHDVTLYQREHYMREIEKQRAGLEHKHRTLRSRVLAKDKLRIQQSSQYEFEDRNAEKAFAGIKEPTCLQTTSFRPQSHLSYVSIDHNADVKGMEQHNLVKDDAQVAEAEVVYFRPISETQLIVQARPLPRTEKPVDRMWINTTQANMAIKLDTPGKPKSVCPPKIPFQSAKRQTLVSAQERRIQQLETEISGLKARIATLELSQDLEEEEDGYTSSALRSSYPSPQYRNKHEKLRVEELSKADLKNQGKMYYSDPPAPSGSNSADLLQKILEKNAYDRAVSQRDERNMINATYKKDNYLLMRKRGRTARKIWISTRHGRRSMVTEEGNKLERIRFIGSENFVGLN